MSLCIGVVGGGFTGAILAGHLANTAQMPLSIDVIEPRAAVGFGLAYGSCQAEHRVNVPSDRMTVFREEPFHFTYWLQRTGALAADCEGLAENGDFYSTRADFGRYVAGIFREAAERNPSGSVLRHRRHTAIAVEPSVGGWRVQFDDATSAEYSDVVLAATHAAPAWRWPVDAEAAALPHLMANPWDWKAIEAVPKEADVGILGTGLTMCDVVVTLRANGHRGRIQAISRRALTPRSHAGFNTTFDLFGTQRPPETAVDLLRLMRARIREAEAGGETWHAVVDALRARLAIYWQTLPLAERAKIVRHLRAWWDVHRFRIAPQVGSLIAQGQKEDWLAVRAGRVHRLGRSGDRLLLDWTPKNGKRTEVAFDAIVNCTGPDSDIGRSPNPMLRRAVDDGFIRADALRLGIDVHASGRAIDRSGSISTGLWATGPLARGVVGEATGVPEASDHARHVAGSLAATLNVAREIP